MDWSDSRWRYVIGVYWIGAKWRNPPVCLHQLPWLMVNIGYARQKNWQKHNKRSN
jgi:hypothetical protein